LNKLKIITTLLIYLFFLVACSTTKNVKPFTAQPAADNQAVVYFYRPSAMSNAIYSPDLYINDEFKLPIKNGKNTRFTLPPGHYNFALEPDKNYSGISSIALNLSAGSTCFIRIDTSLKIKSAAKYEPYQRSFNLTEVEKQLAVKEIAECCMVENTKSKTDQETKKDIKQNDEGFSVDKTQNPFSH
jgi:hypothetical protein